MLLHWVLLLFFIKIGLAQDCLHGQQCKAGDCCVLGLTCDTCPYGQEENENECGGHGMSQCRWNSTLNPGDCCSGAFCNTCPYGVTIDTNICSGKGMYLCSQKPGLCSDAQQCEAGDCCVPESSCNTCPYGVAINNNIWCDITYYQCRWNPPKQGLCIPNDPPCKDGDCCIVGSSCNTCHYGYDENTDECGGGNDNGQCWCPNPVWCEVICNAGDCCDKSTSCNNCPYGFEEINSHPYNGCDDYCRYQCKWQSTLPPTTQGQSASKPDVPKDWTLKVIVASTLSGSMLVLIVCCLYCWIYKDSRKTSNLDMDFSTLGGLAFQNPGYGKFSNTKCSLHIDLESQQAEFIAYFSRTLKSKLIKREHIHLDKMENGSQNKLNKVGSGNFSVVYKGKLKNHTSGNDIPVVIKVPKSYNICKIQEFVTEAENALEFEHPNILKCLGITCLFDTKSLPCLVFDYMEHGDLANILRKNTGMQSASDDPNNPIIGLPEQMSFVKQAALGMAHMASMRYTHGDLAARNCLIGRGLVLKISDFGLTRDVYEKDYYKVKTKQGYLPLRWSAPESISHHIFSEWSDVWSYGVLIWEIFTFGKNPYYDKTDEQVHNGVPKGLQLETPELCPEPVQKVMQNCLRWQPKQRWRFRRIIQFLSEHNQL